MSTLISYGDFIDLFYKARKKGLQNILAKFKRSHDARAASKWNTETQAVSSDFWIIPEIQKQRNKKFSGNPDIDYSDYFVDKYLSHSSQINMLSIGSGLGKEERKFAKYTDIFQHIQGIDIAKERIEIARQKAHELNYTNISYVVNSFEQEEFKPNSFDVILFHSSLHHLRDVENLLQNRVRPLLKKDGFLVIKEYVGPNRLQWTKQQLKQTNKLLKELPDQYKKRFKSEAVKHKAYCPGILRMLMIDPSEAVDSEAILPSLHQYFRVLEEHKMGGNISQPLFKDIAHNFLSEDQETKAILSHILKEEANFLQTNQSDYIFGIYQKK